MTEAGWYEDPEGHGRGRRYWDGGSWTEHYEHPATEQQQQAPTAQPPAQQLPPAGWKDDPEGGSGMRYWDGAQWTDHYHPPREEASAQQSASGGAFQPTDGSFEAGSQGFQPSTDTQEEAASTPSPASSSGGSLDETQLDVRGYQGGRSEPASELATSEAEPAAASSSEPEQAAGDEQEAAIDYGNDGDRSYCENCGATIRSSHKFCPACGHKQEGMPS